MHRNQKFFQSARGHIVTLLRRSGHTVEERDGSFIIRGYSCPLAGVASDHPEVCRMAESLITELVGVPVYEHCDRGERPRCCFEVASFGDTAAGVGDS